MKQLIDVDPLSRTETWHHYDPVTDETTIQEVQDVEPWLNHSKELKNHEEYSKQGIKDGFWHYATIPNALITKFWFKHGVDVFNKNHTAKVLQLLNTEYTALKNTAGKHV